MATSAQIQANRRNALRSTGPRSVEGKAVSRCNALKTGIQAKLQVIPGEDPAELEQLAADYHSQFSASTPLERFLIDSLIDAEWQLRRLRAVEARLWEQALTPDHPGLGEAYLHSLPVFTRLHRRLEAVERSYFRALQQLQRLQPPVEETESAELASFDQPAPPPAIPATPAGATQASLGNAESPNPQPVDLTVLEFEIQS